MKQKPIKESGMSGITTPTKRVLQRNKKGWIGVAIVIALGIVLALIL